MLKKTGNEIANSLKLFKPPVAQQVNTTDLSEMYKLPVAQPV